MRPVLALALFAALFAGVAAISRPGASSPPRAASSAFPIPAQSTPFPTSTALCPPRSLPDHGVCIPVPTARVEPTHAALRHDPVVPRRPDRPEDPNAYRWPVALSTPPPDPIRFEAAFDESLIASDLGARLTGVTVRAPEGAPVAVAALEGQVGDAVVAHAGELVGPTLVTRHRVEQRGEARDYIVLYGSLATIPADPPGSKLRPGKVVGNASDAASPGAPSLYFDIRQLKGGLDPASLPLPTLLDPSNSIAVDPRNVLARAKP